MKKRFRQSTLLTVREITRADWKSYRDFYKGLKNPQHFSGFLSGYDLDDRKTYDDMFDWFPKPFVLFGLWDQGTLIGQTVVSFSKTRKGKVAHFSGSEITDEYRGLGLADTLYEARMDYLRRMGFKGTVMMSIDPDKAASHRAAERNGFVKTGEQDLNGYDVLTLKI